MQLRNGGGVRSINLENKSLRILFCLLFMLSVTSGSVHGQAADNSVELAKSMTSFFQVVRSWRLPEPLPPSLLRSLEPAVSNMALPEDRMQAAAILYRYGNDKGYAYLAQQLKQDDDLAAASILALNQDTALLDDILRVFRKNIQRSIENEDVYIPWYLFMALADWENPKVSSTLREALLLGSQDSFLAIAVARHNLQGVEPQLQRLYRRRRNLPIGNSDRPYFAAALIKLNPAGNRRLFETFVHALTSPGLEDWEKGQIISAFSSAKEKKIVPALIKFIEQYLQDKETSLSLALSSARALGNIESGHERLLLNLLQKMQIASVAEEQKTLVAEAVLRENHYENNPVIQGVMSKEWRQQWKVKTTLRNIPPRWLNFSERFEPLLTPYLNHQVLP